MRRCTRRRKPDAARRSNSQGTSGEFRDIPFSAKDEPGERWPESLEELVGGWIAYEQDDSGDLNNPNIWALFAIFNLTFDHPEWAWKFILATLAALESKKPESIVFAVLAAGPLEDLLASHGPAVIDRIELEARRSPDFRRLLGGVCKNSIKDDVLQRVLKAAPERW